MEIKSLIKEISDKFKNLKQFDDFDDNDYYIDRYCAGIKLKTINEDDFLFIHLDNLPGDDTVIVQWTGSKDDYDLLLDFLEDATVVDIISLFLITLEANKES